LAEMFSNNGSAPNCIVMLAVDIKGVFLGILQTGSTRIKMTGARKICAHYKELGGQCRGQLVKFHTKATTIFKPCHYICQYICCKSR